MAEERKRRRGDRKDAWLVRDLDAMHLFMPYMIPGRTANEAVLNEVIDLEAVNAYLEAKNADGPEFRYTFFHVICAALAKAIALRPKMNYFISGERLYERRELNFAFVVKRQFTDASAEALAMIAVDRDSDVSPVAQIHDKVQDFVFRTRAQNRSEGTTDKMNFLVKLPRWLLRFAVWCMYRMEAHGVLPASLINDDPYHCTVFISNLGSIRMNASYHHLANWGTNSLFVVVGEKHMHPFYAPDGTCTVREALDLGFTIDERIADGVYFSKTMRLVRHLLQHPELLDAPVLQPVDLDLSLR